MRYNVFTPVPDHTGAVGGVHFANGRAVIDDATHPSELAYCRAAGYLVEPLVDEPANPDAGLDEVEADEFEDEFEGAEMPKKSASTEAWRTWAVQHGGMTVDEANTFSRDELVAHFTTEDQA